MRMKKSIINSIANLIALTMLLIPNMFVRKVFLNTLGSDMLGLTSLYTNIISWLSIFDMGIGSAIVFSLYKPYAEKNYKMMNSYIFFYGKFYRKIGMILFIFGLLVSPFIKYLINGDINNNIATIGFILYVINTFISYMFSHRLCILNVAQEAYITTLGTSFSRLSISIVQIILLKLYPNFIVFAVVQIAINLIYYSVINAYISKRFNWINEKCNELELFQKHMLIKDIKALFIHKLGTLVLNATDNILISKFLGLTTIAIYNNYQIIINGLQSLVISIFNGITASIGNLITEENQEKTYEIHKKVFFINFWLSSLIVISLYNTLDQFIVLWIGEESLINNFTLIIILINLYFFTMRGSIDQFKSAAGIYYQDRYAPIAESIINLLVSLILVNNMGLPGIFIGTLVSNITVIFWVKPYVVYKYVFNKSLVEYFKIYFRYLFVFLMTLFITSLLTINIKYNYTIYGLIVNCAINIIIINGIYVAIFYNNDEFKYFKDIGIKILRKVTRCAI